LLIFLETVYFGSCAKAGYILSLSVVCHFVPINNVKLWSAPTITEIESVLLCSALLEYCVFRQATDMIKERVILIFRQQ